MGDWNGPNNPSQDARLEGSSLFNASVGESFHYLDFTFNCDFTGVEFYAWDSNKGDSLDLSIEYYAGPTYGWKRYKKFGKNYNVYPNTRTRIILFPASPSVGTRLAIKYVNNGASSIDFSINKFQFHDAEKVDTSILGEGEDW